MAVIEVTNVASKATADTHYGNTTDAHNLIVRLAAKQDTLVSGGNIKTVNGNSILGAGDLAISGGLTVISKNVDYQPTAGQYVYYDTNGADKTVTPPAAPAANQTFGVNLKTNASNKKVTITGLDTLYIAGDFVIYQYDGASWIPIAKNIQKHTCTMIREAAQSLTSGATPKILLDATVEDNAGIADLANSQVVIRSPGKYHIVGKLTFTINNNSAGNMIIDHNGTFVAVSSTLNGGTSIMRIPCVYKATCAEGDIISIYYNHVSATGNTTNNDVINQPTMDVMQL